MAASSNAAGQSSRLVPTQWMRHGLHRTMGVGALLLHTHRAISGVQILYQGSVERGPPFAGAPHRTFVWCLLGTISTYGRPSDRVQPSLSLTAIRSRESFKHSHDLVHGISPPCAAKFVADSTYMPVKWGSLALECHQMDGNRHKSCKSSSYSGSCNKAAESSSRTVWQTRFAL